MQQVFGPDFPEHHASYPPHLLLFTWPLGLLPYLPAYAIWSIAGLALYMFAAAGGERRPDRLLMLAVAPAVVVNVYGGQNGFLTAALLIGGLSLLDKRPILSGVLFGVLTVKPQLGLLLPLMLVLTGQWRCIASAAATALGLGALTAASLGPEVWPAFLYLSVPKQQAVLAYGSGIFPAMMPTAFMNARIAGLPLDWAWAMQGIVSSAAVGAVVWTFWQQRDPALSTALFVTASFLVTPYAFNYDMVIFGWVLAQLRDHDGTRSFDDRLAMVVWILPVTTMILGLAHSRYRSWRSRPSPPASSGEWLRQKPKQAARPRFAWRRLAPSPRAAPAAGCLSGLTKCFPRPRNMRARRRAMHAPPLEEGCAVRREATNKIRFVIEDLLPPVVRDSGLFRVAAGMVFRGVGAAARNSGSGRHFSRRRNMYRSTATGRASTPRPTIPTSASDGSPRTSWAVRCATSAAAAGI